ncbi:MAG TPA: bacillithiol biosynthesis cysteine-adding enzyme BshC [Bacteroidia bacterium]|nr:bacillithiol biosynthesis cysteine-adding enzyme BshC [Bacteroidia bacterium]
MQTSFIPLSETHQFPSIIIDYLKGEKTLSHFYKYKPDINSFKQAIEDKKAEKIDRTILADVLKNQNKSFENKFPLVFKNIESLKNENTFTVCTGHQLCLFTGPLYFIYKIISTINLAENLKNKFLTNHFVPIYWMASEDHDFEEINHIHFFGKTIKWENAENVGTSVGNIKTDSLTEFFNELKTIVGKNENATYLMQLFTDAYLKNNNLAEATRYLVNELFGKYGLLVLDGSDKQLKKIFSEIVEDDILHQTNFKLVNNTIEKLAQNNISAPVHPREINSFYITEKVRGRIIFENGKYQIQHTDIIFSEKEILEELKNYPEKFSPNVVLRCLYQEKILPNLAYVGGQGEISYWLQYKEMFDHHHINFPILLLRNSVLWLDAANAEKIKNLAVPIENLFLEEEDLVKDFVKNNSEMNLSLESEISQLKKLFLELSEKAAQTDTTLKPMVEAELQKNIHGLKNIENRILKAEKQKQEVAINRLRKIKKNIFPETKMQERYDNFIPFYLKNGQHFISILKEKLNPFDFRLLVISEELENR